MAFDLDKGKRPSERPRPGTHRRLLRSSLMRLRVLTLNVWGLPLGIARHHDARMHAIGEGFAASDADVIALQEVWTAGGRALLAQAGKQAGYSALWHRRAAFGGSGLMVLSRLPIVRREFIRYRLAGLPQRPQHADYYGGKGFAHLDLETAEGPVTFINTHLHAGYTEPGTEDEYRGVRAAQAIELAAYVRGLATPVVAAGDFNSAEGEDAYAILLGLSGLRDLAVSLDRRQPTCLAPHPYRGRQAGPARIDLLLARDGRSHAIDPIALERTFDQALTFSGEPGAYSDHAGVWAEVEITPRAEAGAPAAPDAEALLRAQAALDFGVRRARARRGRELAQAGGGAAAGLLLGAAAGQARQRRRRFLTGSLAGLAGLGLFGGLAAALGSHWVAEDEIAGYAQIREILAGLGAEGPGSVRLRAP